MQPYADELRSLFIVSKATLIRDDDVKGASEDSGVEGVHIQVDTAPGEKCERCWVHDTTVGANPEQPTVCQRCQAALTQIDSHS